MRVTDLVVEFRRHPPLDDTGTPTDLWGTFKGMSWDFWAKRGDWEFRLSEDKAILPELMKPTDPGFFRNGTYADGPQDQNYPDIDWSRLRSMTSDEAERIIHECLDEYEVQKKA
jgi:hypothetical protein